MNTFSKAMSDVFREIGRTVALIFRELSIFPTVLANVLTPVFGLSVTLETRPLPKGDFERRIGEITERLKESGSDAQALLTELEHVMEARRQQLLDAQARLLQLQSEETEVQERVELLRMVRPEAAVAINALLDESLGERDKRGTRRDWLIFGMGVVTSVVVSLLFFLLAG